MADDRDYGFVTGGPIRHRGKVRGMREVREVSDLVDGARIELATSALRTRRSPS